ncbi:hypothetical protein BDV98DRAFT_566222 [Pterulicium gracile]|uniref:Uncharacterized protein n=1 Tax=Pterulicium gracile TaxID=1884261 RepID=A0A5C3QQ71_9AGAR|nr:hypothetical protein BDV98DRAFT_566222 [Pterula gracilis]
MPDHYRMRLNNCSQRYGAEWPTIEYSEAGPYLVRQDIHHRWEARVVVRLAPCYGRPCVVFYCGIGFGRSKGEAKEDAARKAVVWLGNQGYQL